MSFYDDASWLLIPSGIKEDVVYAQKPSSGLGDLVMTRASDATYTDSTGVVRRSPYNLVTYSEMFSDASWTKDASTITANTIIAPNGTLTADTFTANGIANIHGIRQTSVSTLFSGVSYTTSVYAKKGTNNFIQIIGSSAPYVTLNVFANFDLNNGTVGTVGSLTTATIQNVGDGWYRCTMTATAQATSSTNSYIIQLVSSASAVRGESNSLSTSVFLWGAQLVEGTSALDYFPTTDRLNVPRIDFINADGTLSSCGRLLLEPQRTNLLLRSEEFDNAAWGKFTTTVVANAEISPDGTQDAETMTVSTTDSRVEQTTTLTAGTYIFSVYVKVISQTTAGTMRLQSFVDGANVNFTFTPTTQWQRVTATYTAASSLTSVKVRGQAFVGTLAIWGAQLEAGAYATTYIPTTTAAVTRIADSATRNNIYTNGLISSAGGTWFIHLPQLEQQIRSAFVGLQIVASNGLIEIRLASATLTRPTVNVIQTGVGLVAGYLLASNNSKIAIRWNGSTSDIWVNGVKVSVTAAFTPTQFETLTLQGTSNTFLIDHSLFFPRALTDAELAQLTTL